MSWQFVLFVAGDAPSSERATEVIRRILEERLPGNHSLEVLDVVKEPHRAREEDVFAVPTLVLRSPGPSRRIIGDLTDPGKIIQTLEIPTDG